MSIFFDLPFTYYLFSGQERFSLQYHIISLMQIGHGKRQERLRPPGGQFLLKGLRTDMSPKTNSCIPSPERGKKNLLKLDWELREWPFFSGTCWSWLYFRHNKPALCQGNSEDTLTGFYHQEAPTCSLTTPTTWKSVYFPLHVSLCLWRTPEEVCSSNDMTLHLFPHCICMLKAVV